MRSTGLEEAQAGIKIARRNINNLRYADDTTLKSLLMKVKDERQKVGLKFNSAKPQLLLHQPTKEPLDESERGE